METTPNKHSLPRLEKVTLNIGVGEGGQKLQNAKTLLERITSRKAVLTKARAREPSFKIKQGDPIGVKVTLRGKGALDVLGRALDAKDRTLPPSCFDSNGNVSFGIAEYIDFPGVQYDPTLGMLGFDVCTTLSKPGKKVSLRKIRRTRLPAKQRVSKAEAQTFFETQFHAKIENPAAAQ